MTDSQGVAWNTREAERFQNAFYALHNRGEFPSPTNLLEEMRNYTAIYNRNTTRTNRGGPVLCGRLSKLRIALFEREGYVKVRGRWKLNTEIPGETESTGDWR